MNIIGRKSLQQFVYFLISSLRECFKTHRDSVESVKNVLPIKTVDKPFDMAEDAAAFYTNDQHGFTQEMKGE